MSSEARHGDNAKRINFGEDNAPNFRDLLGCNRFLGVIERSEAMEIAVDTEVLVK